ncbi:sushi domain-containing protein 1 isoform X2 [Clupea harengus]|uniref:Sushi domain-containing protein 1 isoform X2 n=1 Tax=Clupea harengus TaxID=7950 RepID=A0A6P8FS39_CLUHA|nr:sushi domain-containing protein 1 isoform X2 [Clupea harengus]
MALMGIEIIAITFLLHGMPSILKGTRVAGNVFDVCTTCHPNATCDKKTDGSGGFACNCVYGFVGNGRTHCEDKDECQIGANAICGDHTVCHNTHGSFYCTCLSGYAPTNNKAIFIPNDGTYCQDVDECQFQGICGEGGLCRNTDGDFECECQVGYRVQGGTLPFHPVREKAFCKAVDCGLPPSVQHAVQLSPLHTRYGSVISYGCQKGFLWREGDNSSVCAPEGKWRGPSLICEEVHCGEPPAFPHSSFVWDRNTRMGAEVRYECEGGFRHVGPASVAVCTAGGLWSRPSLQCEEIVCGKPPVVPNSQMLWNRHTSVGTNVFYECEEGYHKVGTGNISVCTENGLWSEVSFICKVVTCGDPPLLPHAGQVWNGSITVGSTVMYYCNGGFYYVTGTNISECSADGYWTKPTVTCEEIDCGVPTVWPHSCMLWTKASQMGAKVFYECDVGYYNAGPENVSVCTVDGVWSPPNVVCQEISCGNPPAIPNSKTVWDQNSTFGGKAFYECEVGYHNVGHGNVSVCIINGLWQEASVICQEISCGPPPVIQHTNMQWDNTSGLGSVVQYTCKDGYNQEGLRSFSTCTSSGEWDIASVTCKARCGHVPEIANAELVWDNESTAIHRCVDGYYSQSGINMSMCGADGRWQAATMQCREIRHGISHLEVFNERCLRWVSDGKKEDYKVVLVGRRDYQKSFVDTRRNAFNSTDFRPQVCLKLLPATNYTISITAVLASSSINITTNTTIQAAPVPEVMFRDVEGPVPTLWLHRSVHTLDPICLYEVFVLPVEGTLVFDCNSPRSPHFPKDSSCHGEYVAAQIQVRDVGKELNFTVGDEQHYGGFYNAPLENGKDYYIILRTVCQWGQNSKHSCVIWAKARGTSYRMRMSAVVAAGTIAVIGCVVLIGFFYTGYVKN